jgi:hypothetical protein
VPAGFRAQAVAFASPTRGWVLGTAPCGGGDCTVVAGTDDGGGRWAALGGIDAPLAESGAGRGVAEIDVADARHGWAYGPDLFATADGGRTWSPVTLPGGGHQVVAFAADGAAALVLVSPCRAPRLPARCSRPPSLWRAKVGDPGWSRIDVDLPITLGAVIELEGTAGYLVLPQLYPGPDVLYATANGVDWERRPSPCHPLGDEFLVDVAPIAGERVGLLCVGNPGFSKATKRVFVSDDGARTASYAGIAPLLGIQTELAASPDGDLAMSSTSSGSWVYVDTGGRHWATPLDVADGGQGWNDLTYVDADTAFVVHAPAARPDFPGQLLVSRDSGLHWETVDLSAASR